MVGRLKVAAAFADLDESYACGVANVSSPRLMLMGAGIDPLQGTVPMSINPDGAATGWYFDRAVCIAAAFGLETKVPVRAAQLRKTLRD